MFKEDCFFLGTIVKKYSFRGELLIKLDTDSPKSYLNLDTVLIDESIGLVPYFITQTKLHKSRLLRVKFEGVNSESKAGELINKNLFLPLDKLPKLKGTKFYYHEIKEFIAIDQFEKKLALFNQSMTLVLKQCL